MNEQSIVRPLISDILEYEAHYSCYIDEHCFAVMTGKIITILALLADYFLSQRTIMPNLNIIIDNIVINHIQHGTYIP